MKKLISLIMGIGIVVIFVIALIFIKGGIGFGNGNGKGDGTIQKVSVEDKKKKQEVYVIKVDESTIYFDGEACSDIEDLKEKIGSVQAENENASFEYQHEYAIKDTADAVNKTLHYLEETLGISVYYNE